MEIVSVEKRGPQRSVTISVAIEGKFVQANRVQCDYAQDLLFFFFVSVVFNFTLFYRSTCIIEKN